MMSIWDTAIPPVPLPNDAVHVWLASLDEPGTELEWLLSLLSPAEYQRADRFHFARDRQRFIVAHGFVRLLLSAYTGSGSEALDFAANPWGKPYLARQQGGGDLRFNLSHSHQLALVALSHGREVGVDVEYMRPLDDIALIATQFFSLAERAALMALPATQMQAAFYTCWSRKEAVIKALGLGLSQPLDEFDVTLAPGVPAQLLDLRGNPQASTDWKLYDLAPIAGYATALATAGDCRHIACYTWHPNAS